VAVGIFVDVMLVWPKIDSVESFFRKPEEFASPVAPVEAWY
jgi:hypothetical protein